MSTSPSTQSSPVLNYASLDTPKSGRGKSLNFLVALLSVFSLIGIVFDVLGFASLPSGAVLATVVLQPLLIVGKGMNLVAIVWLEDGHQRRDWIRVRDLLCMSLAIMLGYSLGTWWQLCRGEANLIECELAVVPMACLFWTTAAVLLWVTSRKIAALFQMSGAAPRCTRLLAFGVLFIWIVASVFLFRYVGDHPQPID